MQQENLHGQLGLALEDTMRYIMPKSQKAKILSEYIVLVHVCFRFINDGISIGFLFQAALEREIQETLTSWKKPLELADAIYYQVSVPDRYWAILAPITW